ncbi:ankyrin repeat domain-containing protein [Yangia mangrovi]|uniref:Ankyrin repeat domain-containing protein n=1 Tax=Alloyangia mangrovi TaxID=1779329 RepID=A0ABT2KUV6_9RHOB|nr:ankyrin repeat domain-containing protein [Alloyangia mangrovi]MCT4373282.1 ankyrin repeat domain-containing protein [Alloyangia mangrovi]
MRRAAGLGLVLLVLGGGGALAQPAAPVCSALETRLSQSRAALEGRVLNEALFEAAALDCPETARRLLEQGASVEARNRFGGTPPQHCRGARLAGDRGGAAVAGGRISTMPTSAASRPFLGPCRRGGGAWWRSSSKPGPM